jgi:hypothetical protein
LFNILIVIIINKINVETLDDHMPYNNFSDLLSKNRLLSATNKQMAPEVRSRKGSRWE